MHLTELRSGDLGRPPLFWLHGMLDGNGAYMRDIARRLDPRQSIWMLHPAGYDGSPFSNEIRTLAAQQLARIRTIRPNGPYHLGGFCNGAVIAFEIAHELVVADERVASLTLVSPPAWNDAFPALRAASNLAARMFRLDDEHRVRLLMYLCDYQERMANFCSADGGHKWRHGRTAMCAAGRKIADIVSGDHLPIGNSGLDGLQFTYDRYVAAIRQYVPEVYPGTVDLIWGRDVAEQRTDRTGGWERWARPARNHFVEGGHFCALESPDEVGSLLRGILGTERFAAIA